MKYHVKMYVKLDDGSTATVTLTAETHQPHENDDSPACRASLVADTFAECLREEIRNYLPGTKFDHNTGPIKVPA